MLSGRIREGLGSSTCLDSTWEQDLCSEALQAWVLADLIVAQEASSRTAGMAVKMASEVAGTTMDCVWQHGRPCRP